MYANPVILGGLFSNGKYGGMWLMENGLRRTSGPVHAKLSIRYEHSLAKFLRRHVSSFLIIFA